MTILLNGEERKVAPGATVADLVTELGRSPDRPGAAVAVNGEVLARSQWSQASLHEGDRVEVLGAVQGG